MNHTFNKAKCPFELNVWSDYCIPPFENSFKTFSNNAINSQTINNL